MRLTDITKAWIKAGLTEGDIVIDATLGNGHDALFLAQCIGKSGTLYGFDIQHRAIEQAKRNLSDQPCNINLFQQSHDTLKDVIPLSAQGCVKAIMFNLGWLPGSDKSIITTTATTLSALEQSLGYLAAHGRMSVVLYPGHTGGDTESSEVMCWLSDFCLNSAGIFTYEKVESSPSPVAPILLKVYKNKP